MRTRVQPGCRGRREGILLNRKGVSRALREQLREIFQFWWRCIEKVRVLCVNTKHIFQLISFIKGKNHPNLPALCEKVKPNNRSQSSICNDFHCGGSFLQDWAWTVCLRSHQSISVGFKSQLWLGQTKTFILFFDPFRWTCSVLWIVVLLQNLSALST